MASIPNEIHFVWLGSPTKPDGADKFLQNNAMVCGVKNLANMAAAVPYTIHIWIDGLTMAGDLYKNLATGADTAIKTILRTGWKKGENPLEIGPLAAELEKASKAHGEFHPNMAPNLKWTDIVWFQTFCAKHGFELHFLDEAYIRWSAAADAETKDFANLILFETLAREGNYGAASDIIRLQILAERGGIYCDHDTTFQGPFGPLTAEYGFLHAVHSGTKAPVNANMAAVTLPPDNFIAFYRAEIRKRYRTTHFLNKESLDRYIGLKTAPLPARADPNKPEPLSQYLIETMNTSGPDQLRSCLQTWRQKKAGGVYDYNTDSAMAAKMKFGNNIIVVNSAQAWDREKAPETQ